MWSSTSPVYWKSLKSDSKTYHDMPNNIIKELFFLQKSYGNTTRLKIVNTIKKKSVPFPPRPNKSSVANTSKVDISRLKVCAHHFFPIFVSFCTITFFDHHFFQFFEVLFFTPTYFFQFFLFFLTPVLDSFRRVIYD